MTPLHSQHYLIVTTTDYLAPVIRDSLKQVRWAVMDAHATDKDTGVQVFELNIDEDHMRDITEDVWRDMPGMGGQCYFADGLIKWKFHETEPNDSYGREVEQRYRNADDEHRLTAPELGVGRFAR